ncbi:NB-ARC domain-containing protein [Methanosarcina sp.]|uniref:NB-ARC domain-containing protein n=1 Tax=Methanosarcina sp. TaxID=2213 RepID=UPI002AB8C6B6|nr:NB-ARC domain-containing protein [Methanosarcina sp.]MDY9927970.1 NB-ARC domain-containing protein [Methanosarcina sp.]
MKPTAEDLINGEISSVGVYLFNRVNNCIFEKEPIEKTAIRKADFEKIIEEKTEFEEFPAISREDIKAICEILYDSNDIESIIKQLYVYQSGMNKSLEEIKEDFVSLFPRTIKLENGKINLETGERSSFLLKVFEVLDEGIQTALNRAANEGSSDASNALSNRRHFDMKNEVANGFKDVKKLISDGSRGIEEKENPVEKLPSLFISYAREDDEPFVEKLYKDLKENGFDVWWDRTAMKNRGRTFLQEIRDAIGDSDILIAVIGPKAIESDSVRYEWEHALLFSKGVIPILRMGDYTLLPPEMSKLHCPDFREQRPYEKALEELLRLLREPIPPLGPMVGVPSLPPNYLPRTEDLKKIKELILTDTVKPVVITYIKQITALQGMGGMGKSVLSAAVARTTETRKAFCDGILWVTVGLDASDSDLIECMRLIGTKFGDDPANYGSKREAEASLSNVLSDKVCLIILDDIWKVPQATPFVNALGSRCRLLITTRNDDVVTSLGAQEHKIEILSKPEALKLLANWCEQEVDSLPSEAAEVAKECGYLPLALSICGAMAKSGISWSYILEALQQADLEFIEAQLPNYPDPNVGRALKVSVDFFSREDPDAVLRYQELVIFPEDELVPEDTIAMLWKHTGNLKRRNVEKLLTKLKDRSLLRLDGEAPNRLISLHDLQLDYLRATAGDLTSLHNKLLEAYGKECGNKWSDGPEDGYFFEHLAYHMKEAGRKEELRKLLLDFEWMCTKLKKVCIINEKTGLEKPDVNSLLYDYDYLFDETEIRLVQGAIKLSFNAIVKDKTQLAGQLLGRLLCFHEKGVQSLLNQAIECKNGTRLLPKISSLIPPGGQLVRVFEENEEVRDVAVTPNGKYVISASDDNTLKVWDLETGEEKITLRGHNDSVRAVSVTPNGRYAVSASIDRTLKVWNLEKGKEKTTFIGHTGGVNAVAITPDGKSVISASDDHTLKVWDLETGEEKAILTGHNSEVKDVAVTPDGRYAVSSSYDRTLRVWNLKTGKEKTTIMKHIKSVSSVAITPDGKSVISDSNDQLKVWDIETGEEKAILGKQFITWAVAVAPNGKYAVSASAFGEIVIWDIETGKEKAILKGHDQGVIAVAITPNSKYAISASYDRTLKVWDLEKIESETTVKEHNDTVWDVTVTPNGKYAISASSDQTLKVWNLETGKEKATIIGHTGGVNAVAVTPNGKYAISASSDQTLKVWDLETGKEKTTFRGHDDCVNAVAVTPNGKCAISASVDCTIKVWDFETGKEKSTLTGHDGEVSAIAIALDGKCVISASSDQTLKVWDLETGKEKTTFRGHKDCVSAVAVTPNGKYAISASEDHALIVWNLETGEEKAILRGHNDCVNAVAVTPNGKYAISASLDRTYLRQVDI